MEVMACHKAISPDHIAMLSQTHKTLDRRLSGKEEKMHPADNGTADGSYSPELAPSPITVDGNAANQPSTPRCHTQCEK